MPSSEREDHLVFVIVPGKSIGPFQLGMTKVKVKEISGQTGVKTDIGPTKGGMFIEFDQHDRASKITVAAEMKGVRFEIAGEEVTSLYKDNVRRLLSKIITLPSELSPPGGISPAWYELTDAGIAVSQYDFGDPDIFTFEVFLPGRP